MHIQVCIFIEFTVNGNTLTANTISSNPLVHEKKQNFVFDQESYKASVSYAEKVHGKGWSI